ncbi:SDR family NAD(P)-dependent oxidoreductase [Lichenicoccus sp.]|uniref:SDR family NAD(P)-dependent oxidoreductase n=1 Tax=Lichenicoccus sp. TaxID=2781899 RepID=UPI003D09933E
MIPSNSEGVAVVVGASGGIGGALVRALQEGGRYRRVLALSRRGPEGRIDLLDEDSIAKAARGPVADALHDAGASLRLVIVATGVLQGERIAAPERSYRGLDADSLMASMRINMIGPALVAKHMLPLLPRQGRSVFAALSARVGSIGDNRLGGWHAYRSAKAALNMMLRNFAIELARTHPEALVLGLHPGTVATALSQPFQAGVATEKLFTPDVSAARLLSVIEAATVAQSGQVLAWDGAMVPP